MKTKTILACGNCGSRNYTTHRNKERLSGRLEIKKFCKHCNTHTLHKETK